MKKEIFAFRAAWSFGTGLAQIEERRVLTVDLIDALAGVLSRFGFTKKRRHIEWLNTEGNKAMGGNQMELQPVSYKEASAFIEKHHNQHVPSQGWKFGIAVNDGEKVVGVITVGRPVAPYKDDGWTLEVTQCVTDGTEGANTRLYSSALKATMAMGYKRLITYTLVSESGIEEAKAHIPGATSGVGSKERATLNSIVMFPPEKKTAVSDIENLRNRLEEAKRMFEKQGYHDWTKEVSDALVRMDQNDFSFLERLWLKFAPTCDIDDLIIIAPHLHVPPLTQEQADELNDELAKVANATFAAIEGVRNKRASQAINGS